MNKEQFLQLGFDVHQTPNSLIITTPQVFASGDPACFWVKAMHDKIIFNDYGSSLNALELSLPNPDQAFEILKSNLKKIDNQIILDGTALIRETTEQQIGTTISEYINLYALLTNYRPKNTSQQENYVILDNIYNYLKKRFDNIQNKVSYKGISGKKHQFAFQTENNVYDFARPNKTTTGLLLRKMLDVQETESNLKFHIFLDDSNKKRFETESRILTSTANIKPLSLIT